jgi:hypothetical protein
VRAADRSSRSHRPYRREVEDAIVISNDSGIALPLSIARSIVPVGTVNPGIKQLAGAPKGGRNEGPGNHWWRKLSDQDYYGHQMPYLVAARLPACRLRIV